MDAVLTQLQPSAAHGRDRDEDGYEGDAAAWGSMGGFGNLGRTGGVEGMSIPRVPDVRVVYISVSASVALSPCTADLLGEYEQQEPTMNSGLTSACLIPQLPHRFNVVQPPSENQASSRNDDIGIQVQRRYHRMRGFEGHSGELCW
jgi:hypothetical protein